MNIYLKKEGFAGQKSYVMPADTLKRAVGHPLCKSLYITDIGFYPNAKFHNRERKNGCQQHILIYCVKGKGWCQINGEAIGLQPNQMVIIPKNTAHQYGADKQDPWTIYWLHFDGDNAIEMITHLQNEVTNKPLTVPLNEDRDLLFEKLMSLLEKADNMDNMVDAFLCFPYYLTSLKQTEFKLAHGLNDHNPVEKSITFMKAKIASIISLQSLADHVSLSVSHYSALFQQQIHSSPINYFNFLKMQYACQLLENTNLSVKQIGLELGYNDAFHFSRIFSKMIGISPRGFRKR